MNQELSVSSSHLRSALVPLISGEVKSSPVTTVAQCSLQEWNLFGNFDVLLSIWLNTISSSIFGVFTAQRSLSRKGSQRGGQRNTASTVTETDTMAAASASSRGAALIRVCMPDSPLTVPVVVVGSTGTINPQGQQVKMTMTTSAITNTAESKYTTKSAGRRSRSWLLDPWRIVLFFTTLDSKSSEMSLHN